MRRAPRNILAFTLIEILIVVVILGILATIVVGQFASALGDAERVAFVTDLNQFVKGAEKFYLDTDHYPPAANPGEIPAGFESYIGQSRWTGTTPISGSWDVQFNESGVTSAIGVVFGALSNQPSDVDMTLIDKIIDNGDLNSGAFQKFGADSFYYIILR